MRSAVSSFKIPISRKLFSSCGSKFQSLLQSKCRILFKLPDSPVRLLSNEDSDNHFIPFKKPNSPRIVDDEVIEIYDPPDGEYFEEDPQFEYFAQQTTEHIYPFIDAKRGSRGVFEINEIVKFLQTEGLSQIVCIRLPESAQYGDYMVIATANTKRHLLTTMEILRKLFKMKRNSGDILPTFEGLEGKSEWVATDLGNIILHLFSSSSCRETYNLESLWGAGAEYDEQAQGLAQGRLLGSSANVSSSILSKFDWEKIISQVSEERKNNFQC